MALVGFFKGVEASYNAEQHLNGIYQCTDTNNVYIFGTKKTFIPEGGNIGEILTLESDNKALWSDFPTASETVLGGIKVGSGLAINNETGVLSATGGGTADSVDWNNITSKPSTFPPSDHEHTINEITDFPTFKTINGENITGTGNIEVDTEINTPTASATSIDSSRNPVVNVTNNSGTWNFDFLIPKGAKGELGTAASFGNPTASVETLEAGLSATVSVTASGSNTNKVFNFKFGIPKGADGTDGSAGTPGQNLESILITIEGDEVIGPGTYTSLKTSVPGYNVTSLGEAIKSGRIIVCSYKESIGYLPVQNAHIVGDKIEFTISNGQELFLIVTTDCSTSNITAGLYALVDSKTGDIPNGILPVATTSKIGAISVGDNLDITPEGLLSVSSLLINKIENIDELLVLNIINFSDIDEITSSTIASTFKGLSFFQVKAADTIVGTLLVSSDEGVDILIFTGIVEDMSSPTDSLGTYCIWKRRYDSGWKAWELIKDYLEIDITNFSSSKPCYLSEYPTSTNIIIKDGTNIFYPLSKVYYDDDSSYEILYYNETGQKLSLSIASTLEYNIYSVSEIKLKEVSLDWYNSNTHDATTLYLITG